MSENAGLRGEIILYGTPDGRTRIQLRAAEGTVWLNQSEIAALFGTTKQNVSLHVRNILADGEFQAEGTVKESLTVQAEGSRTVQRTLTLYSLDMILAVGYRVRSPRATQFRQWATTALKDYLVKGFVMNDESLKDPTFDYFDELLERIRDIRASEARFYQKLRDILALSPDYDAVRPDVHVFYATIQNKMLYAITRQTAAELIVARANPSVSNMGLTAWKGERVRKGDVSTAKNYLGETEIKELNMIVTMFLDTAELRTSRRSQIMLAEWETILDGFLAANELLVLRTTGRVSHTDAERVAHDRYRIFDEGRKKAEKQTSELVNDFEELTKIAGAVAETKKRLPVRPRSRSSEKEKSVKPQGNKAR